MDLVDYREDRNAGNYNFVRTIIFRSSTTNMLSLTGVDPETVEVIMKFINNSLM